MIASRVLLPGMASCVIIIGRSVAGFFCFEIDERDRAAAFAPIAEGSIDCDCAFRPHPMNWPIEPKRSAAPRSIGAALSRCCPRQLLISRFGDVRRGKAKKALLFFFLYLRIYLHYVHTPTTQTPSWSCRSILHAHPTVHNLHINPSIHPPITPRRRPHSPQEEAAGVPKPPGPRPTTMRRRTTTTTKAAPFRTAVSTRCYCCCCRCCSVVPPLPVWLWAGACARSGRGRGARGGGGLGPVCWGCVVVGGCRERVLLFVGLMRLLFCALSRSSDGTGRPTQRPSINNAYVVVPTHPPGLGTWRRAPLPVPPASTTPPAGRPPVGGFGVPWFVGSLVGRGGGRKQQQESREGTHRHRAVHPL